MLLVGCLLSSAASAVQIVSSIRKQISDRIREDKILLPAHFFVLFASEGEQNKPRFSHTFASFIRVEKNGSQTWKDISWLPDKYDYKKGVCVFNDFWGAVKSKFRQPCPLEKGRNYSLFETLVMAQKAQQRVYFWRPLLVSEDLYVHGAQQSFFLNHTTLKYIADDTDARPLGLAKNCIHAVSDALPIEIDNGGIFNTGWGIWGVPGSRHVLKALLKSGLIAESEIIQRYAVRWATSEKNY